MKVKTDVEMIGFGREDGGFLGVPFPKLSNEDPKLFSSTRQHLVLWIHDWHTYESFYIQFVNMLLFSLIFLILDKEIYHYVI